MTGIVGIDVGGTFTDLFYSQDGINADQVIKVPSTPHDPSIGVIDALRAGEIDPDGLDLILHGTTIATNTLINGAPPRARWSPRAASATCWSWAAATGRISTASAACRTR